MRRKLYKAFSFIIAAGFLFVLFENLTAFPTGYNGATKRPGSPLMNEGCVCHGEHSPTKTVSVRINGPSTVEAGDTVLYSISITGGPDTAGGCNIAAYKGQLLTLSGDTTLHVTSQIYATEPQDTLDELTHNHPKRAVNDTITFVFRYIAPNEPNTFDTLYATGNSVNLNDKSDGDEYNFAPSKVITITKGTSIKNNSITINDFDLKQNYPNPFNPVTKISYSLKKSAEVKLSVYDRAGKLVSVLSEGMRNTGNYDITFDGANLASGIYFYKLEADGVVLTKRMALVK